MDEKYGFSIFRRFRRLEGYTARPDFGQAGSSIHVADISPRHEGLSSNINTPKGVRTFCLSEDLSIKKCIPCTSEMRAMTEQAANILIAKLPEWNLVNEDGIWKLHRTWKVKTFRRGLEFFQRVADLAEIEGHHPDLHLVGWNNVKIDIWTHAVGGLTENDFILATKINKLRLNDLLRIIPSE